MTKITIRVTVFSISVLSIALASVTYGSVYSDAVSALNPDAYWRLNETSGIGADSAGSHPLTGLTGGATQGATGPRPVDGLLGFDASNQAYEFTGSANGATTDDYIPVTGSNPRTIVAWLNMDIPPGLGGLPVGTLGGAVGIFDYGTSVPTPNTRTGFKFQVAREIEEGVYTGRDLFTLNIQGSTTQGVDTALVTGQWYMLAAIVPDGATTLGETLLFVDGVVQGLEYDLGETIETATGGVPMIPFRIGHDYGGFGTDGRVDEVTVWESALSQADIENLWSIAQTGESTVVTADFDGDGDRDGADFLAWQRGFDPSCTNCALSDGDSDGDGDVDEVDLANWESQFGTTTLSNVQGVPEPTSVALVLLAALTLVLRRLATNEWVFGCRV